MAQGNMLKQRISAGGIVLKNNRILLVHHYQPDKFDFWVLPGGGVEGAEGLLKAAEREVFEETNLTVTAVKIAYIEDFIDEGNYVCKFWVYCRLDHGNLSLAHKDAAEPFLQAAKFFSRAEIQTLNVFPSILKDKFWQDLETEFSRIKYLGFSQYG